MASATQQASTGHTQDSRSAQGLTIVTELLHGRNDLCWLFSAAQHQRGLGDARPRRLCSP